MELELIQTTHAAKRCPACGEVTLRGHVRWAADSTCRACGYDFAAAAAKETMEEAGKVATVPAEATASAKPPGLETISQGGLLRRSVLRFTKGLGLLG